MTSSPIVAKWELSRRIANRRKDLNMDVATVTGALKFSRNYWSAVENQRTLLAVEKLQQLFELMDFPESERAELLELRSIARKHGWWDDYSGVLDDETRRFIGLEDGATSIRTYESNLIPGLLQISEYTHALLELDPARNQVDVDDYVAVRQRRQQRLTGAEPAELTAVLSEASLVQQVGGPELQREQLQHLLALIDDHPKTLHVHIVPFTTNPGIIASASTLVFLDYSSAHLPTIAYQEAIRPMDQVESDDDGYRQLEHSWNEGLARAADPQTSITAIQSCLDRID